MIGWTKEADTEGVVEREGDGRDKRSECKCVYMYTVSCAS